MVQRIPDRATINALGCQGFRRLNRRDVLRVGSLGALSLSLGDLLRLRASADDSQTGAYSAQAAKGQLPIPRSLRRSQNQQRRYFQRKLPKDGSARQETHRGPNGRRQGS
ncbi:MAG: hypothetical protein LW724_14165 [Planctomycetaceae bacterium]|nr:hypothetical protein [Planctomycetaceae bacterium]